MPTLHVSHSPDSDDAFMFWALAEHRIDTEDRTYVHELADIESLNRRAMQAELEITAVSFHAYAFLADRYALLPNGGSLGDNYGPRVVSTRAQPANPREALAGLTIGIPGELTTAFLALQMYQPDFTPVVIPFDEIEDAVVRGTVDAGLLIHEGQLTYASNGLELWVDLGVWWHQETDGLPLPLGCNVVRRDLGGQLVKAISRDLRSSITYGLDHRTEALAYAMRYARGLDLSDADTFVGMYVNDYTVDYGDAGRKAARLLYERAHKQGLIPRPVDVSFVDDA